MLRVGFKTTQAYNCPRVHKKWVINDVTRVTPLEELEKLLERTLRTINQQYKRVLDGELERRAFYGWYLKFFGIEVEK